LFRAGEVQAIVLWLTPNTGAGEVTPGSGAFNPLRWLPINNVTLTYNGEIFSRFDVGSAALWNLASDSKSSSYNTIAQTVGSVAFSSVVCPWVVCPFGQVNLASERDLKLFHGKPILNAVVNLQFQAPAASTSYVLNSVYLYNSSLLCSRGSSEYIF